MARRPVRTGKTMGRVKKKASAVLDGTRVLDMTWLGPGPFCATILGDLGAEIVKVHEPDPDRRGGVARYSLLESPGFPGLRNCRAIGVDLKTEEGRKVFHELARTADVVIESFRPGVTRRLRIDYRALKRVNPSIVYVSLTGYGQEGPYRDVVGHDINYISVGGLLGITGTCGGPPVIPGVPVADFAGGGMSAAIAILAALRQRDKTGKGQYVDVSITDGVVGMMSVWINPYLTWGVVSKRGETWLSGQWPWYDVYETKDGKHISIGALEPWFFARLCGLVGREDFIENQLAEGEKREEIRKCFRETFLTRTRDEWVETLRREDVCVAPVYSIEELVSDPQLAARGIICEMPHPELGSVRQVGSMIRLSDSPAEVKNWCMRFGQHTNDIMRELGHDRAEIQTLRRKGAIG